MFFVDTVETTGLGNRSYLAGGTDTAVAVDPPRDIDRVLAAAHRRGVRIAYVAETHVHNDYVSGALDLARITGARCLVPAGAGVSFPHTPVADGDTVTVDGGAGGAGGAGEAEGARGPGGTGGPGGSGGGGGAPGVELRALATPGHTPHHTSYVLTHGGSAVAAFTGGSLLIGTVGRPDLVEPRLTESLARAQHASAHRLARELDDAVPVLPTHGFGSFCSATRSEGESTTIGAERAANAALTQDVDAFVTGLLAGLDDVPAYYAHMGPANAAGPAPVDLTPPRPADAGEVAARLAAGEWVVDLRGRVAFAAGHLAGSLNFEGDGKLATYLAWLIPWGKPVTLLAATADELASAQRELVRVGIDRPAAAATGGPASWARAGEPLGFFPRGTFTDLAAARKERDDVVVLDVRRATERATAHIEGSAHLPLHTLYGREAGVPDGTVWVHCGSGLRATVAASLLAAVGRDVVLVDDVFEPEATARAGLPVVDGDGRPHAPA
ncbi:MBL fold metallo-hydrolase [Streptomyces sp. p1417]|uniref:MBL fold metallo-hydrolase n=1 Tax=Streptomyces typhae TaxID=2681492 RepID=A0A6L6X1B8_9ACTN|nr:MBL fold metallo-hydrolase [Streptomyces typhae]